MDWIKKLNQELQERRERLSTPEEKEAAFRRLRKACAQTAANTLGEEGLKRRAQAAADTLGENGRKEKSLKGAKTLGFDGRSAASKKAMKTMGKEGLRKRARTKVKNEKEKIEKEKLNRLKNILENLPIHFYSKHLHDYSVTINLKINNTQIIRMMIERKLIEKIENNEKIGKYNPQWYRKI